MKTKIIVLIIALVAIIGFTSWGRKKHNPPIKITLSTSEVVEVPTNGRKFGQEIIPIAGVRYKYLIAFNTKTEWRELPQSKELKYGDEEDIKVVFYRLKPGQGIKKAKLKFVWLD